MFVIGLTGGVGSGKTTVADLLASHGTLLIDADKVAREVVALETPGLQAISDRFGREMLTAEGTLDRDRLARFVFASKANLDALNAIVHPLVRESIDKQLAAVEGADTTVVLSVPLMVESGHYHYDILIVVDIPEEIALRRVVDQRGWTEDEAKARMRAQASRRTRLDAADFVIANDGSLSDLADRVEDAWSFIVSARDRSAH